MERRPTLSLNEWTVLGLLVERARHGYGVAVELRPGNPLGDVWKLDRPVVYRALERLGDLGLVEPARSEPGEGGPSRTVLRATRPGRASLLRWLDEPVTHLRDVRSALLVKLALIDRLGRDRATLVRAQREALRARFDELAEQPDDRTDLAGLWRHHLAAATRRFLDDVEA